MSYMRIVIIDDNKARREKVESIMPDYAACMAVPYGDSALSFIKPDANGDVPDVVILDGDDKKGMGLYVFDWMKNKSGIPEVKNVPVIVMTQDEFSDRSLDFLDIDDAIFYEGDIDEDSLYSCIMDVISDTEFAAEPDKSKVSGEKSYDRIAGLSMKIDGETAENKRSIVIDVDSQLGNLEAAIERGRKKTELIKALMESALDAKRKASIEKVNSGGFLNKIRVEKGLEPIEPNFVGDEPEEEYDEEDIPEEFRLGNKVKKDVQNVSAQIGNIGEKLKQNPFLANASHNADWLKNGAAPPNANLQFSNNMTQADKKDNCPIVLVVDDEARDRQMCEISLSAKYNVVLIESGMKAIDYFVKRGKADLILLDTVMPNLGGVQTLYSIRYQPNGRDVPVIFMIDKRYPVAVSSLAGANVLGVIQKPVSPSQLTGVVDSVLRGRKH